MSHRARQVSSSSYHSLPQLALCPAECVRVYRTCVCVERAWHCARLLQPQSNPLSFRVIRFAGRHYYTMQTLSEEQVLSFLKRQPESFLVRALLLSRGNSDVWASYSFSLTLRVEGF